MERFTKRYLLFILFLIVLGFAGFYYKNETSYQTPQSIKDAEVKNLAEKVGRLMILPTDETPTVATVSDPTLLKDRVFFIDAKVGDKVLIYKNAKKAILYNPTLNKIVNIAPVNTGDSNKSPFFVPNAKSSSSSTPPEF